MRIQYMSDLHMEFFDNWHFLNTNECKANGDVLVLAGDSFYLRDTNFPKFNFWDWASKCHHFLINFMYHSAVGT